MQDGDKDAKHDSGQALAFPTDGCSWLDGWSALMASNPKSAHDRARERLTGILQSALPAQEDAAIEDETQRLMLHLAREPYDPVDAIELADEDEPVTASERPRLVGRILGKQKK
jgi:hypothetical protein